MSFTFRDTSGPFGLLPFGLQYEFEQTVLCTSRILYFLFSKHRALSSSLPKNFRNTSVCVIFFRRIVSVRETRVTGILSHVLIGLSILFIDQLKLIPRPVLDGLLLYLAITALHSNQLFERIMLLVTEQVRVHCMHRLFWFSRLIFRLIASL